MKFFVNGNPIDYQGAREGDAIETWISKKTGPASKLLETEDDLTKHSEARLSVLLYLPQEDEDSLKNYMGFAAAYDDVTFGHTHNTDYASKLEMS